jgi:hypothetical protein
MNPISFPSLFEQGSGLLRIQNQLTFESSLEKFKNTQLKFKLPTITAPAARKIRLQQQYSHGQHTPPPFTCTSTVIASLLLSLNKESALHAAYKEPQTTPTTTDSASGWSATAPVNWRSTWLSTGDAPNGAVSQTEWQ